MLRYGHEIANRRGDIVFLFLDVIWSVPHHLWEVIAVPLIIGHEFSDVPELLLFVLVLIIHKLSKNMAEVSM